MVDSLQDTLVLLSGGIDSTTALALAAQRGGAPLALFIDYGQPAASAEAAASAAIAEHYGARYHRVTCNGVVVGAGEVRARNALLLHVGLFAFPAEAGVVIIAVHGGTPYRDCSGQLIDVVQRSYDFHTDGAVNVVAPFIDLLKADVVQLAREIGVPLDITHSCERADRPCGECLSCLDREHLLAGA